MNIKRRINKGNICKKNIFRLGVRFSPNPNAAPVFLTLVRMKLSLISIESFLEISALTLSFVI
ncbi:MAG: hypothetical protein ACI9AT_001761 [Ulvibacter sp.]|jgi:hypothetical protein